MNTLLGEIATLNDVQFPRYRLAFKFRKLQKSFLLDFVGLGEVQDVLHNVGVQALRRDSEVPISQLRTAISELYTSLRVTHPILNASQLQEAQEHCLNWLMMAFQCSAGHKVYAGALKMTLCLFSGSKTNEKARYIFSMLANANGAVEKEGIRYFCKLTQQLAWCLHEQPYAQLESLDTIFQECLVSVRSAEDVEEEQLDGGIRRQWLSQFEFVKLFTMSPEPRFLSWLTLWYRLPSVEKVVHPVRCAICTRKPIVCFRYTCTHCPNFNLCQMCFLKGRTADKHSLSHNVLEFTSGTKGHRSWHHRLLGVPAKTTHDGRLVREKRELFVYNNGTTPNSFEDVDTTPQTSINDMLSNSQQGSPTSDYPLSSHQPAIIRIGSADSTGKNTTKRSTSPRKDALHPSPVHSSSPARRISYTSSSSSDSVSSGGGKFNFEGASGDHTSTSGTQPPPHHPPRTAANNTAVVRRIRTSASDSGILQDPSRRDLSEVNKRLSMEVDQLLSELPTSPPSSTRAFTLPTRTSHAYTLPTRPSHTNTLPGHPLPANTTLTGSLQKLQVEEQQLQSQVNQLSDKREKLAHELHDLMSHVQRMHFGFQTMSSGVRTPSNSSLNGVSASIAPVHYRCDSAPLEAYPGASSRSPTYYGRKGSFGRVYSPPLLDPLAEYTASQLAGNPENYRMSVAW